MKKHCERKVKMKQKKLVSMIEALFLISGAVAFITGCQLAHVEKSQTTAEYIGSYEGVSSGEVLGLQTVKVDKAGIITGEFKQNEKNFPISGNIKNDGKFTASAHIRAASGGITISGTIDKKSGKIFGTIEKDAKKSLLCGYKQTENVETVNKKLFSVWELKSARTEIEGKPLEIKYPMTYPIDKDHPNTIMMVSAYFLFMEKNELYSAAEIRGVPNPSPVPNLSNGLFKAKINYSTSGKQIAVVSNVNGIKANIVGEFNITGNNLIIEGLAKINFEGKEDLLKLKYSFEKVLKPTVDEIKNASEVSAI